MKKKAKCDGRTDRPTDRPTDTVTYRSRARDKKKDQWLRHMDIWKSIKRHVTSLPSSLPWFFQPWRVDSLNRKSPAFSLQKSAHWEPTQCIIPSFTPIWVLKRTSEGKMLEKKAQEREVEKQTLGLGRIDILYSFANENVLTLLW